jgi:hypothetical protein
MSSACQTNCTAPSMMCGTACVNTQTDPNHCGDCDTDCGNRPCSGGMCQCAANEHRCDGECEVRSVESCGPNCASCSARANATASCGAADQCVYNCNFDSCGGQCCAQGQTCVQGACTTPTPPTGGSGGPIIIN